MSIAPPSDIVMDVAQAADPERLKAATARLAQIAAGATSGADFDAALSSTTAAAGTRPALPSTKPLSVATALPDDRPSHIGRSASPYQKFEAAILQNFVADMLPKDSELFGDKASADAYRSMMAEQLATQIAKSGRLGIAAMVEKAHGGKAHTDAAADALKTLAARGLHPAAPSSTPAKTEPTGLSG